VRALSDIASELVMEAITTSLRGCILDGCPRTQEEATKVASAINLTLPLSLVLILT
jgi:hypothetical protein